MRDHFVIGRALSERLDLPRPKCGFRNECGLRWFGDLAAGATRRNAQHDNDAQGNRARHRWDGHVISFEAGPDAYEFVGEESA